MISTVIKKIFRLAGLQIERAAAKPEQVNIYRAIYGDDSVNNKRFYNIGAGAFSHSCWTNVDFISDWYKSNNKKTLGGINYDLFLLQPVPVESNTAEIIYTSHTIEHVNNAAVQNLFNEAYRMLKPGGFLRIVTPDTELEYRAWQQNDRSYFYWIDWYSSPEDVKRLKMRKPLNQETTAQIFLENFASQASLIPLKGSPKRIDDEQLSRLFKTMSFEQALDYCTSLCDIEIQKQNPGAHINWFTEKKLREMLQKAGFKTIYRSAYGQSFCSVMRDLNFFDTTIPKVSLYVEAVKD